MKINQIQERIERNPQLIVQVIVRKPISMGLLSQSGCAFDTSKLHGSNLWIKGLTNELRYSGNRCNEVLAFSLQFSTLSTGEPKFPEVRNR
ncbi:MULTISPECIES: hypothetical protein [Aerosakkonema]|uniref:hypothetical protein n=1 Tax=Aerosakkonema TaxID=1246629 RepID=UPI0035B9DB35